ncbi:hypothetical protein [Actinokineospora cianjurensis]|uniref:Uncharacterized protein n=1 Tax=Actinokineospora cianjurensis TaxID=585224 RepID=A0A421B6G1_9PSEU|nr:hypothetical protein [Actinokineospora cianjurensis]RLK59954.1 hypothetical protein CLV68_0445 [Actinokineospora cianjurensis]
MSGQDTRQRHHVWSRTVGVLAGVVRWVGLIAAAILVAHVVLVMADASRANPLTAEVRGVAGVLALAFKSLFTLEDTKLGVLLNYGIAAVFWLVASSVVAKLIRRLRTARPTDR